MVANFLDHPNHNVSNHQVDHCNHDSNQFSKSVTTAKLNKVSVANIVVVKRSISKFSVALPFAVALVDPCALLVLSVVFVQCSILVVHCAVCEHTSD